MQPNFVSQLVDSMPEFYMLDDSLFMIGLLKFLKLQEFIDSLIPLNNDRFRFTVGECVVMMFVSATSFNSNTGLYQCTRFWKSRDVSLLIGRKAKIDDNLRFNLAFALDRLFEYGLSRFVSEVTLHCQKITGVIFSGSNHNNDEVHVDVTNFTVYTRNNPRQKGEKEGDDEPDVISVSPITSKVNTEKGEKHENQQQVPLAKNPVDFVKSYHAITDNLPLQNQPEPAVCDFGPAKNGRVDKLQLAYVAGIDNTGNMICGKTLDGNYPDSKSFPQIFAYLGQLSSEFFDNIKLIVSDAAGSSWNGFNSINGLKNAKGEPIELLSRLNHSNSVAQEAKEMFKAKSFQDKEHFSSSSDDVTESHTNTLDVYEGCVFQGLQLCNSQNSQEKIDLRVAVLRNSNLKQQKVNTYQRRANKQKQTIEKALSHYKTKCEADMNLKLDELRKKNTLCIIQAVEFEFSEKYSARGNPKLTKAKKVITEVKVKSFEVVINNILIEEKAESECHFVLAVNETGRDWTAQQMLDAYHRNTNIENLWKVSKNNAYNVTHLFLKIEERRDALITLIMLSSSLCFIMQNYMRKVMREQNLSILSPCGEKLDQPTYKKACEFINSYDAHLVYAHRSGSYIQPATGVRCEMLVTDSRVPTSKKKRRLLPAEAFNDPIFFVRQLFNALGKEWSDMLPIRLTDYNDSRHKSLDPPDEITIRDKSSP